MGQAKCQLIWPVSKYFCLSLSVDWPLFWAVLDFLNIILVKRIHRDFTSVSDLHYPAGWWICQISALSNDLLTSFSRFPFKSRIESDVAKKRWKLFQFSTCQPLVSDWLSQSWSRDFSSVSELGSYRSLVVQLWWSWRCNCRSSSVVAD